MEPEYTGHPRDSTMRLSKRSQISERGWWIVVMTVRPLRASALSVRTIESTSFSNFSPANTCRIVMGI